MKEPQPEDYKGSTRQDKDLLVITADMIGFDKGRQFNVWVRGAAYSVFYIRRMDYIDDIKQV